jgi:hypothetical protein
MLDVEDYVIRNCRIGFKCERDWSDLTDRGNKKSRYCTECKQEVILCKTVKQLKYALSINACVAIPVDTLVGRTHLVGDVTPLQES